MDGWIGGWVCGLLGGNIVCRWGGCRLDVHACEFENGIECDGMCDRMKVRHSDVIGMCVCMYVYVCGVK